VTDIYITPFGYVFMYVTRGSLKDVLLWYKLIFIV